MKAIQKMTATLAAPMVLLAAVAATPAGTARADDAMLIHSAGLEAILADERDQGLVNALRYVGSRLAELPGELNADDIPAPVIELVWDILRSPMTFRMGVHDDAMMREVPVYMHLVVHDPDADRVHSIADRFNGMLGMMGAPVQRFPGDDRLQLIDEDGVAMVFGTITHNQRPHFVVSFNTGRDKPTVPALPAMNLPAGVSPVMAFHLDMQKLNPLMEMMFMMAGPDGDLLRQQMEMSGLAGENAMSMEIAFGYGRDRGHLAGRFTNMAALYREQGLLSDKHVQRHHLRLIPFDAVDATISASNLSGLGAWLDDLFEMMAGESVFDAIADATGIDLRTDFFAHLGDISAVYMSDTTGGGGILSMTLLLETTNMEGMGNTLASIENQINAAAEHGANGYVRLKTKAQDGRRITTLTFPGLPIPFEPSYAVAHNYLVFAATPAALTAALDQISDPASSLLDREDFRRAGGDNLANAMQVTFTDTSRRAREGYGLTSLLMSAIANAVRSPVDAERDPGNIMPGFNDVVGPALPAVTVSRIDGQDLVMTGQFDRSFVTNTAAAVGTLQSFSGAIAAGVAAGATLPAIGQARGQARAVQAMAQARMIAQSVLIYSTEHPKTPDGFDPLIRERYITADILRSPFGEAWDGKGDFWLTPPVDPSTVRQPHRRILLYDRSSYLHSDRGVIVVYFDGHVEQLSWWEFHQLIDDPIHEGINFDVP